MKKKKPDKEKTQRNGTHVRRSMCTCGHIGDSPFSDHADLGISMGTVIQAGHGGCLIDGCPCRKFTWKEYV